jgi:hypothetical protein
LVYYCSERNSHQTKNQNLLSPFYFRFSKSNKLQKERALFSENKTKQAHVVTLAHAVGLRKFSNAKLQKTYL